MSGAEATQLRELAERIYIDAVPADEVLQQLGGYTNADGVMADTVHFLFHFVADADLRAKDERYGLEQRRHLQALIDLLKTLE